MRGHTDNGGKRPAPPPLPSRWGRLWPLLSLIACCQSVTPRVSHEVLNTLTALGQPTYELMAAWCQGKQWSIVADDALSIQEKSQRIEHVRNQCHKIYTEFESFIALQKEVRILVEAADDGTIHESEALQSVIELRQQLIRLQAETLEVVHALGSEID